MSTGGDDGATIQANRDGFGRYQLRARRLIDVSTVDTSVRLFGQTFETPIFLCPVSGHRIYNPDGELATARAARSRRHLQMLSTMTTTGVEDVNAAGGRRLISFGASSPRGARRWCSRWTCSADATWNSSPGCSHATGTSAARAITTARRASRRSLVFCVVNDSSSCGRLAPSRPAASAPATSSTRRSCPESRRKSKES